MPMAKIIEFCGSPGVGKTTLYKELSNRWKRKYKWIPGHYLWLEPSLRFKYAYKFLLYLPDRLKKKVGFTFYKMQTEVRNRFVESYPEYMNFCWNDLTIKQKKTLNGRDLRFKKAEQLRKQIEAFQFLKEYKTDKIAMLEEGLIHLLDVISFYDKFDEIAEIINVMPLPDALIYIKTDIPENVKRLRERGEFISFHALLNNDQLGQLTQQSQKRRKIINKILEDKGIPILYIDAKATIKTNTDKIISFIETL